MIKYVKSARYESPRNYRGCTIKDAGRTYVCINEFGGTIGESLTIPGCEGIIDNYLDNTLKGKSAPSDMRKSVLYDNMLGYLVELIDDSEELVHTLKNIGFTDEELRYELDWLDE